MAWQLLGLQGSNASLRLVVLCSTLASFSLGCIASGDGGPNVTCRSSPLYGGVERASYVALDATQEDAICHVIVLGSTPEQSGYCSGTLVAPGLVLTAAHCFVDSDAEASVVFGKDADAPDAMFATHAPVLHDTLDLALLPLVEWNSEAIDILPIAVDTGADSEDSIVIDRLIQIAGYGLESDGRLGRRRFAVSRIRDLDEESFVIDADHRAAACFGDSGGPALVRGATGEVLIAGVLTSGASSCGSTDTYVRLAPVVDWLMEHGAQPSTQRSPAGDCEELKNDGRCFDDGALWCEGDTPLFERCSVDRVCGFDPIAGGYRCIARGTDPCDGIDVIGACDGDDRVSCEDGMLRVLTCNLCGATCVHSVATGRAICNASSP